MAPVLSGSLSLGIEVSRWSAIQISAQRTADAAALAGALYYSNSPNSSSRAQNTATYTAHIAEINGVSGTSSPSWTGGTQTLSDNNVTVQITGGIQFAKDIAVKVTVRQAVPVILAGLISSLQSVTVKASGVAEIINTASSGGAQPCMTALKGDTGGITTDTDITFSGTVNIDAGTCAVRSDGGIALNGNVNINTAGLYAAGSIVETGSVTVVGPLYPNDGQIPDPYANNTPLQSALTAANSASGPSISCSGSSNCTGSGVSCGGGQCVLQPGTYSGLTVAGSTNLTLNPGLYTINGNVYFGGNTTISGSGISIIMGAGSGTSHQLTATGNITGLLAANTSAVTGCTTNCAIPGILFASQSTVGSTFIGDSGVPFTGLLYYPNGMMNFAGNAATGSTGCAEIIASTIVLKGSSTLASNCSSYGTLTFGAVSTTTTKVALVQ